MHNLKTYFFTIVLLFWFTTNNAQCAMCKAVVENGDASMAEGINNGITYLMVFPYILVGALLFTIYRYNKKSKK
jgi:hypothetical protein